MASIHRWGRESRTTIDKFSLKREYYFELGADDDEDTVQTFFRGRDTPPEFIVAPNLHDSRSNSVAGANIRRLLGDQVPIAVMVTGKKRRERMDMTHWLIEEGYLPMFPRFMHNEANPAVPLTRHQLLHEMRPILDREPDWMFVLYGYLADHEQVAYDYIKTMHNQWEILCA